MAVSDDQNVMSFGSGEQGQLGTDSLQVITRARVRLEYEGERGGWGPGCVWLTRLISSRHTGYHRKRSLSHN